MFCFIDIDNLVILSGYSTAIGFMSANFGFSMVFVSWVSILDSLRNDFWSFFKIKSQRSLNLVGSGILLTWNFLFYYFIET